MYGFDIIQILKCFVRKCFEFLWDTKHPIAVVSAVWECRSQSIKSRGRAELGYPQQTCYPEPLIGCASGFRIVLKLNIALKSHYVLLCADQAVPGLPMALLCWSRGADFLLHMIFFFVKIGFLSSSSNKLSKYRIYCCFLEYTRKMYLLFGNSGTYGRSWVFP